MTNESHNPKQNRGKDMDRVSHMKQDHKVTVFEILFLDMDMVLTKNE